MFKKLFMLFKIGRKLSTSGAISSIYEMYNIPIVIKIFFFVIGFNFRDKKNSRLRIATKYPNLTNKFFATKGVTQYRLISSLGATETYPFTGSSEIITDITSTGSTLKANNLRGLKDGSIFKSYACVMASKKSLIKKNKNISSHFFSDLMKFYSKFHRKLYKTKNTLI